MNAFFSIDGVTVFGHQRGTVSVQDLCAIKTSQSDYLHVVRHFSKLDINSRNKLKRQHYTEQSTTQVTDEMIEVLLQTAGSKFNPKLQNLKLVLSLLLSYNEQQIKHGLMVPWIEYTAIPGKYFCEISFTVTAEQKLALGLKPTEEVGTIGVVLVDQENKKLIKKEIRGKGDSNDAKRVNLIKDQPAPTTDIVTVCLIKEIAPLVVRLGTIYTSDGQFSPPFPNLPTQSKEEFSYNKTYWEKRAFFN